MSNITIIRNAHVYAPRPLGVKDVMIGGRHILAIGEALTLTGTGISVTELDARGMLLFPGLVDQHVHMAGGGGEGGFHYRTPEISLSHITTAGVTTVVGVLGTDGVTRTTRELLAKAQALDFEGVSTYIYSGAYQIPTRTITGMPRSDIVLIDKIIGIGEIAIADSRSSQPTHHDLAELASEARVGGLLAGKAGVLHLHLGDDDTKLQLLFDVLQKTELPRSIFVPTHLNRNPDLLKEAIKYAKEGGIVDLTSGIRPDEHDHMSVKPSIAIKKLLEAGVHTSLITMSSDSNGSSPIFDDNGKLISMGIGSIATLWEEIRDAIVQEKVPIEVALSLVTENVARLLKLEQKGTIQVGADADLLLTDADFRIVSVFAKSVQMVADGRPIVFGTYEDAHLVPGAPVSPSHTGQQDTKRGRAMIEPSTEDPDDFPDPKERQQHSTTRHYNC